MIIKKIPAGTNIYVSKQNISLIHIQPGQKILSDSLYVKYDVKVDGYTVIPKGTRIEVNWISEIKPQVAVQIQTTKIFLQGSGQEIVAHSEVMSDTTELDSIELENSPYILEYDCKFKCNNSLMKFNCSKKRLQRNRHNSLYLTINAKEIKIILVQDYIPFPIL